MKLDMIARIPGSGYPSCRNLAGTLKPAWIKASGGNALVPDTPFIHVRVRVCVRTRAGVRLIFHPEPRICRHQPIFMRVSRFQQGSGYKFAATEMRE